MATLIGLTFGLAWLAYRQRPEPTPILAPERVLEWPEFEQSVAEVRAAQEQAIAAARRQLDVILTQSPEQLTFESTLVARDALIHEFTRHWYRMELLQSVSPHEHVREAASEAAIAMEQWYIESIELGEPLYRLVEAFSRTPEAATLGGEDRLLLDDVLDEYRREGLMLSPEDRVQITDWHARLAELTTQIDLAIQAAEGIVAFEPEALEGLGAEQLQTFERDSSTGRYLVRTSLQLQYDAVMQHATRRETRRRALEARLQRGMAENAAPILEVVQLRTRIAERLGYESWADYRIEPNMAENTEEAQDFIRDLDRRLDRTFEAEQLRLRDLARDELDDPEFAVDDLRHEDIPYYLNLLLERDYAVDEQVVRQYFAEQPLLGRIFDLYEEVFALDIVVETPEHTWADDVQVARISDANTGRSLGAIYLDLHPRPGKYTHFATFQLVVGRQLTEDRYQAPICAIVGNWPIAVGDQPSLWTRDDVSTFLHEFGHALHEVLTEAKHDEQAGTNVPLDFVEVPSQSFERWLRDPATLRRLAVHYQTGEPMPDDLINRVITTANVGVGHVYSRQTAFGMIDFEIHTYSDLAQVPDSPESMVERTNAIYGEWYYELPEDTALLASFGHLFAGYDAGYYSYAWSDAIAADLTSVFRRSKQGFTDRELGARYREAILEVGSSRPVDESIRTFLGREWALDAFLDELLGD